MAVSLGSIQKEATPIKLYHNGSGTLSWLAIAQLICLHLLSIIELTAGGNSCVDYILSDNLFSNVRSVVAC